MKETLGEMMARVAAEMPGPKWISTSVGVVNTGNKRAAQIAARKLFEKRRREAGK